MHALSRIATKQFHSIVTIMPTASSHSIYRSAPAEAESTLLARVQAEFREMPGLSLTKLQAQKLWQLDEPTCRVILSRLVASGFLRITSKGHYTRPQ